MGSNERGLVVSGGLTGSLAVISVGFKLAFPDMIVPFGWAIAVLVAGVVGLVCTAGFAIRAYVWPGDTDETTRPKRVLDGLRRHYHSISQGVHSLICIEADAEFPDARDALIKLQTEAHEWIEGNMGDAASHRFVHPPSETVYWGEVTWEGTHDPAVVAQRSRHIRSAKERLEVLDTFLQTAAYDGKPSKKK